jgi:Chaperone of endosialidase
MSAEPVKRSQYFNPPSTECPHSSRNHFEDWEEFHLPMARMHHAALHGHGVATGLEVSAGAQEGGTQVVVSPGIALNADGELIALAADGQADIGIDRPGEAGQQIAAPFRVGTAGRESGSYYLCVQFAQTLRFTEGSCGKLEQTPWLRLLPTAGDLGPIEAREAIVLAIVDVDAEGIATVRDRAEGLAHRRQVVGQGTGELRLRRSDTAAGAVADRPSGRIAAGEAGGLRLSVADAADALILDRDDGGRFSSLEIHADDARFFGNLEVPGSLGLASWRLRAGGSETDPTLDLEASADRGSLHVRNAGGNREVMLGVDEGGGVVATVSAQDLQLRAGGNNIAMTLKADGRVGIGTAAPAERLEVDGRIKAGRLSLGNWLPNPGNYVFVGTDALNQADPRNYALLQGSSGFDLGRTFLNSPKMIDFRIGNFTRMLVANDGKVGIGTSSPQATLHVATGTDVTSSGGGFLVIGQTFGESLGFDGNEILARSGGAVSALHLQSDGGDVWIHSKGGSATVMIKSEGRLGIGIANPVHPIHLVGGAHCTGREWRNASSLSCKREVQSLSLDDALEALGDLRPVRFKYVDDDEVRTGFIAEEVPDLVATSDRASLSPMDIVAVLTRVLKFHQKQIQKLSEHLTVAQRQSLERPPA